MFFGIITAMYLHNTCEVAPSKPICPHYNTYIMVIYSVSDLFQMQVITKVFAQLLMICRNPWLQVEL